MPGAIARSCALELLARRKRRPARIEGRALLLHADHDLVIAALQHHRIDAQERPVPPVAQILKRRNQGTFATGRAVAVRDIEGDRLLERGVPDCPRAASVPTGLHRGGSGLGAMGRLKCPCGSRERSGGLRSSHHHSPHHERLGCGPCRQFPPRLRERLHGLASGEHHREPTHVESAAQRARACRRREARRLERHPPDLAETKETGARAMCHGISHRRGTHPGAMTAPVATHAKAAATFPHVVIAAAARVLLRAIPKTPHLLLRPAPRTRPACLSR